MEVVKKADKEDHTLYLRNGLFVTVLNSVPGVEALVKAGLLKANVPAREIDEVGFAELILL